MNMMPPPQPSPASSSYDLAADADEAERTVHRRSIYRSPGTSSSPDLATLLKRARERTGVVGSGGGSSSAKKDKEREKERERERRRDRERGEPMGGYEQQTLRQPTGTYSSAALVAPSAFGERPPREEHTSHSHKDATLKAPKSSVRAKTSALWGKMMGQGTASRERSKTDASMHPASHNLMNAFAPPPVPAIPPEHRSPAHPSPIADVFSSSTASASSSGKRALPSRKPLPDIMTPESKHSDDTDRSLVFVEKQSSPLPPLPNSPPAPITPKRRSNSVSNDARALPPIFPIPVSTPNPQTPNQPTRTRKTSDIAFGGLLDVFKGELSVSEPISLDLHDPSTPPRARPSILTDAFRRDRSENNAAASSSTSTPVSPVAAREETATVIVPPRSSSLKAPAPRHAVGGPRLHPQQQSAQIRSNSGPATLATHSQVYRDGARLRGLHRSTASSSEPSLVAAIASSSNSSAGESLRDGGQGSIDFDTLLARGAKARVVPAVLRRGSEHDIAALDSAQPPASPSPAISGEEQPDELEARGKELATRCWNENEDFLPKEKIAEWLGGHGTVNGVALRHYIDFFDFAGLRLDLAFRRLCGKLFLKGETQQVDRILEQFSRRYWDCNPDSVYGSANLVHAVSYSLLLLNTDLHVAELSARMSRNQFVRNTMFAIQTQLHPSADPSSAASAYSSTNLSPQLSSSDLTYDDCGSSVRGGASDETDMRTLTRSKRSNSTASWNSVAPDTGLPTSASVMGHLGAGQTNESTQSVHAAETSSRPSTTHGRAWEADMETLLKDMYTAIKQQQILQPLTTSVTRSSLSSLSPGGPGMMRNRSLRTQPDRLTTLKRGSIRGLQSILSVQSGASPYSSNSSVDGRISPSPSFATSTHEAMYGSSSSFLNPALGFASNLSHTIIREAQEDDDQSVQSEDSASTTISISDEELALLGAPWAKEGMLCRKQYWESAGKRAKDKGWLDVFVVIQKGELNMFTFGDHTSGKSGTFGGGNWLANADPVGTINLAHSLAHALPPPGYHKRPHCMVLTLASRGVYFFQAGTEELVNEWVSTCNYWAARMSKEPLAGGVSNMEYGWNRVMDIYGDDGGGASQADLHHREEMPDSVSVRSGKSTRSKYAWRDPTGTVRGAYSPRADKTYINDWKAPLPPTVASTHDEETQLDALRKHVMTLKQELKEHTEVREPMAALYHPRTANAIKAQSNWEEKSQYLLREIVKYDLYVDSLQAAISLRLKKRGEKALEHALSRATPVDDPTSGGKWGDLEETISEEVEPTTPMANNQFPHRKDDTAKDDDDADD